jgi:hypothetical protein
MSKQLYTANLDTDISDCVLLNGLNDVEVGSDGGVSADLRQVG